MASGLQSQLTRVVGVGTRGPPVPVNRNHRPDRGPCGPGTVVGSGRCLSPTLAAPCGRRRLQLLALLLGCLMATGHSACVQSTFFGGNGTVMKQASIAGLYGGGEGGGGTGVTGAPGSSGRAGDDQVFEFAV
jgi:hypothetical protein